MDSAITNIEWEGIGPTIRLRTDLLIVRLFTIAQNRLEGKLDFISVGGQTM